MEGLQFTAIGSHHPVARHTRPTAQNPGMSIKSVTVAVARRARANVNHARAFTTSQVCLWVYPNHVAFQRSQCRMHSSEEALEAPRGIPPRRERAASDRELSRNNPGTTLSMWVYPREEATTVTRRGHQRTVWLGYTCVPSGPHPGNAPVRAGFAPPVWRPTRLGSPAPVMWVCVRRRLHGMLVGGNIGSRGTQRASGCMCR